MRYVTDIQINQLIVHIVDPWRTNGFVLSERTLPLENQQRLVDYFVTHIQNSLQDSTARAARFVTLHDGRVSGICKAMLAGNLNLVDGSRQLAERLYQTIQRDRRISVGDLAVGFYQAKIGSVMNRYVALMKIDPSEVFRHKTERDIQGHQYVSFEIETDVMPTTREKLQKCAFVQALDPRPEYDMMLLDRQRPGPRLVARFFTEDYLGAELALDSTERTDRLYRGLMIAQNLLRPRLQPQENEIFRQTVDNAIASGSVDVDTLIGGLPVADEHKEQINQTVSSMLPDREFEIDETYAQKKLRQKRRFRGDYDLRIDVSADSYGRIIRSVELIRESGRPPFYRIIIETEKWEEVPR
jgi:hypothetical protein